MDFVGVVATIVVAVAQPFRLNAAGRRRSAPASDPVTNRFSAVQFVLAVIAVLIAIAHLHRMIRIGSLISTFVFRPIAIIETNPREWHAKTSVGLLDGQDVGAFMAAGRVGAFVLLLCENQMGQYLL